MTNNSNSNSRRGATYSYIAFDEMAPGIVEDGELTDLGARLLDEHYEEINAALKAWAEGFAGTTVEFTDTVTVTALGRTASRGGPDYLSASPAEWVADADEALREIIEADMDARLAGIRA